jgi:hypothetical protein
MKTKTKTKTKKNVSGVFYDDIKLIEIFNAWDVM